MIKIFFRALVILSMAGCSPNISHKEVDQAAASWEAEVQEQLPYLGHRNWILVVDKAYPAPSNPSITVIDTRSELLPVLEKLKSALTRQNHVRPIFYVDKELDYLTDKAVPDVTSFREKLRKSFEGQSPKSLLHNDVFKMMDNASSLFKIVILKTESEIPYSSVFVELDCKYWDHKREAELRSLMDTVKISE